MARRLKRDARAFWDLQATFQGRVGLSREIKSSGKRLRVLVGSLPRYSHSHERLLVSCSEFSAPPCLGVSPNSPRSASPPIQYLRQELVSPSGADGVEMHRPSYDHLVRSVSSGAIPVLMVVDTDPLARGTLLTEARLNALSGAFRFRIRLLRKIALSLRRFVRTRRSAAS